MPLANDRSFPALLDQIDEHNFGADARFLRRQFSDSRVQRADYHRARNGYLLPLSPTGRVEVEGDMTREARIMAGIILITVPSIQYGGYFLLTSLMDRTSGYMDNPLRQNFFRAGHAHAGVIVILSLICQVLADAAALPNWLLWVVRVGIPAAAIFLPLGFFLSVAAPDSVVPNRAVMLIYIGVVVLAFSVVTLGIGLLRGGNAA